MKPRTIFLFSLLAAMALPVGVFAQGGKPSSSQRAAAAAAGQAVIMRLMYGNYDPRTKTSLWAKPSKAALEMLSQSAGPLYSRLAGSFPCQEAGNKKLLFVTSSAPRNFDCHGCAPLISVAVFSQESGKWKIETTEPALATSGAWGKPGEFKLAQIGPERYALVVRSGFTAQGDTSETAIFYAREGAKFKQILVLDLHGDNGGNCDPSGRPCFDFNSTYEFKPGGTGPYYNLIVTSTGTRLNDKGKVAPAKKRQIYVFKNGEYVVGP
jgi:hypothetical protein